MVPLSHVLTFALAAFVIIVIPGPNVLFAIGRALVLGRRPAVLSVLGTTAGSVVPLLAVAFGLGALLTASAVAFAVVKVVGAAYLVYLGISAIRQRKGLVTALNADVPVGAVRRALRQGFVVGATNPKTLVLFGAVLPQFTVPEAGDLQVQMLLLGSMCLTIQLVSDSAWALLAGTARSWFARSPRRLEAVGSAGGLMIIGVGAGVALGGTN
ncbi:LysE family translocator [Nocardia aurantia]|uniref:Homoserine/homoserine lactone efflux protein n=1 Tax=Nocardia aurantia TaxID=2585199 RepID=A0A7K0E0M3_9NOCA|nr:LysE family translocator [Nocardia aurantia]MQY31599.1 Homoserine/homoserine lactone efflux protein [Nocardia aurantia]